MAQVIEVRPYAIKDPALPHVIQRQPHRVGVVGCILPCLGRSQIMVSLVTQPAMMLAILSQCQASKHVSSNCAFCLAHQGVPCQLAAPPQKTTICWSLSGGCPLWGCSGTAFTMLDGLSIWGLTLGLWPHVHRRAD